MTQNLELNYLMERLAFANTAPYLYNSFRANGSVLLMSHKLTSDQLIAEFQNLIGKSERSMEELTTIYAIVIALSFKPKSEVETFFNDLKTCNLKWADRISALYFSGVKITTESKYDLNFKFDQNVGAIGSTAVSSNMTVKVG